MLFCSGAASAAPSSGNGGHDDDVFKVPRAPPPPAASAAAKKKQQTRHLVASPQLDSSVNELYDIAMYLTSWVPILRKGSRWVDSISSLIYIDTYLCASWLLINLTNFYQPHSRLTLGRFLLIQNFDERRVRSGILGLEWFLLQRI